LNYYQDTFYVYKLEMYTRARAMAFIFISWFAAYLCR